jgi:hypothetical protein
MVLSLFVEAGLKYLFARVYRLSRRASIKVEYRVPVIEVEDELTSLAYQKNHLMRAETPLAIQSTLLLLNLLAPAQWTSRNATSPLFVTG